MSHKTRSFRDVVSDIADRISNGDLKPGDQLLSVSQMAAEYGVSSSTIDRAMSILKDRGLVVGRQGKASYVAEPRTDRESAK